MRISRFIDTAKKHSASIIIALMIAVTVTVMIITILVIPGNREVENAMIKAMREDNFDRVLDIYESLAEPTEEQTILAYSVFYSRGVKALEKQEWAEASQFFEKCLRYQDSDRLFIIAQFNSDMSMIRTQYPLTDILMRIQTNQYLLEQKQTDITNPYLNLPPEIKSWEDVKPHIDNILLERINKLLAKGDVRGILEFSSEVKLDENVSSMIQYSLNALGTYRSEEEPDRVIVVGNGVIYDADLSIQQSNQYEYGIREDGLFDKSNESLLLVTFEDIKGIAYREKRYKQFSKNIREPLREPVIGATTDEVLASMWGLPDDIVSEITEDKIPCVRYIYEDKGKTILFKQGVVNAVDLLVDPVKEDITAPVEYHLGDEESIEAEVITETSNLINETTEPVANKQPFSM